MPDHCALRAASLGCHHDDGPRSKFVIVQHNDVALSYSCTMAS